MAYDPVLMGRVPRDIPDDIDTDHTPPRAGWPSIDEAMLRGRSRTFSLRLWQPEDATLFRAMLDDREVWKYMPQPHPGALTAEMAADLIALSGVETHHEVRAILWADEPVGQVRWEFQGAREAELSYWLGRAWWARGIAGVVVPEFVGNAVRAARFDRITARVHRLNPASQRILRRAGLTLVGPVPDLQDWLLFERLA